MPAVNLHKSRINHKQTKKSKIATIFIIATAILILGVLNCSVLKQNTSHSNPSNSPTSSTKKSILQKAYKEAVTAEGFSSSKTKIEHTDGGMIQISDNGKVITVRMPSDSEAHTKNWLNMVAQIIIEITGISGKEAALEKLQNVSVNRVLDFQEVKDTNDYISEFVGQIELTDKISAVIGVEASDNYPFMYFAFYEKDANLLSATYDICSGFYTRSMYATDLQFMLKDAADRYYTSEITKKLFTVPTSKFTLSTKDDTLTLISSGLNQNSMLRGESIIDNLTSCTFATMGIPDDILKTMTNDRKNNWKSSTYSWGNYKVDVNYSKENDGHTPYYIFSKKDNITSPNTTQQTSVTIVEHDDATTAQIMHNGAMSTQITIPVSCTWNVNDYEINSSGYLRKKDGSTTRTNTTMSSSNKYAKYGALTCETEIVKIKYSLPEGYTSHSNLGGAYRANNDKTKQELEIHVEMSIFADGKEDFYMSSDLDGYQFNVYDENNSKVESYFIKLTPKFNSDQNNFLRSWKARVD